MRYPVHTDFHVPDNVREGFPLVGAWEIHEITVQPSEEEKRRGALREDIQRAITSVEMPGGLLGLPHPVRAVRDVGARPTRYYVLVGRWTGGKLFAQSLPLDSSHFDWYDQRSVQEFIRAAEDVSRMIARELRGCDTGREVMTTGQGFKIMCEHGSTAMHYLADSAWDAWFASHGREA